MRSINLTQDSLSGLRSILIGSLGMLKNDAYASILGGNASFGQIGIFGHKNQALLRAYDTGETTQYDLLLKPAGDHRWKLEKRGESLFEMAQIIAAKVVK